MAQVFISYPSNDDGHLNAIIKAASAACQHVSVWTAQGLEGGENYWDIIRGEIARRDVVVMLITRAALEGDGVKTELNIARRAGKPIIPVIKTSDVALEELRGTAFEGLLLTLHMIQFKQRFGPNTARAVSRAVRAICCPTSTIECQTRAFVNFKGGVGKTTLCGLAGIWLARQTPAKVLLVDLDPQANLTNILIGRDRRQALTEKGRTALSLFEHFRAGRDADPRHDMHAAAISSEPFDALAFRGLPIEVLPQAEGAGRLDLLAGDRRMSKFSQADGGLHELFAHNFGLALGALQAAYDHILIDCGPTATLLSRCAFQHAAEVIAPVSAQETSTDGLVSMLADARELFGQDLGTMIRPIFNKVRWGTKFEREYVEQFFADPTSMDEMLAPLHGKQFAELIPLAEGLTDTMRVIRKCVEKDGDLAPLGKAQAAIEAFCRQLASDEGDADRPEAHLATSAAPLNRLVASGGPAAPGSDGGKPVAMNEVLDKLTSLKSRIGNATSAVPVPKVLDIQRLIKDQFRRSSMTGGQFLDRLTDDAVRLNSLPPPPAGLHTAEVIARWLLENLSPEAAEALVRRTGDENAR